MRPCLLRTQTRRPVDRAAAAAVAYDKRRERGASPGRSRGQRPGSEYVAGSRIDAERSCAAG